MKRVKIILLIYALISLLTGCSNNNNGTTKAYRLKPKKEVTVRVPQEWSLNEDMSYTTFTISAESNPAGTFEIDIAIKSRPAKGTDIDSIFKSVLKNVRTKGTFIDSGMATINGRHYKWFQHKLPGVTQIDLPPHTIFWYFTKKEDYIFDLLIRAFDHGKGSSRDQIDKIVERIEF